MSTLEELQKENTDLKDSVYHLKDLVDVLLFKLRIAESGQEESTKKLQKENNELKAHCERLKAMAGVVYGLLVGCKARSNEVTKEVIDKALTVFQGTPKQSLNEIKAQGIEEMFYEFENEYTYHSVLPYEVLEYAKKLRGEK